MSFLPPALNVAFQIQLLSKKKIAHFSCLPRLTKLSLLSHFPFHPCVHVLLSKKLRGKEGSLTPQNPDRMSPFLFFSNTDL